MPSMPAAKQQTFARALVSDLLLVAGGAVVVWLVFQANYNWIQYHFYIRGPYLFDSGENADFIWRNPYFNPRYAEMFGGFPLNAVHFSPLHNIANGLSYLLPLSRINYYASFEGTIYASIAAAIYCFLVTTQPLRGVIAAAVTAVIAGLAAFVFAFNGGILGAISYPHFEMFWVGMAFCFFWMAFTGRMWAAAVFLVLAVIVREDAGFHLFGFIAVTVVIDRFRGVPFRAQRTMIAFGIAAFCYSVAALLAQKYAFTAIGLFSRLYSGDPPFAHLSAAYVLRRSIAFVTVGLPWVTSAFLTTAVFALIDRRPAYLVGFLATGPWILLHIVAQPETTLHSYRVYPIVLAMAWPLLERARTNGFALPASRWLWSAVIVASIGASSWYELRTFTWPPEMVKGFVKGFHGPHYTFDAWKRVLESPNLSERFGRFLMDDSVMAFQPRPLRNIYAVRHDLNPQRDMKAQFDTFFYWQNNYYIEDQVAKHLRDQSYPRGYRLAGTNILIATRLDLRGDPDIGRFLLDEPKATKFPFQ